MNEWASRGGTIANTGDLFLAAVRQTVYRRSLPLATRNLRIIPAFMRHEEGLVGAAELIAGEIFSRTVMNTWLPIGSPAADIPALYAAGQRRAHV